MTRAVLSLGSNLGDRESRLREALRGLTRSLGSGSAVLATSPVYETPPWGPVPQGDFLNLVAIVEDPGADATSWLARAHALEAAAGRERDVRWGPRTLDVDVIAVWEGGDPVLSDDPILTLPHPQAASRAFVLAPWLAIDPAAQLPGAGAVADLLAALPADERDGVRLRRDLMLT